MSNAACKAAICDDKAQNSSDELYKIPEVLKEEWPELRIEVSEYIIKRNNDTLAEVIKMIGDL